MKKLKEEENQRKIDVRIKWDHLFKAKFSNIFLTVIPFQLCFLSFFLWTYFPIGWHLPNHLLCLPPCLHFLPVSLLESSGSVQGPQVHQLKNTNLKHKFKNTKLKFNNTNLKHEKLHISIA